MRRRWQLTGAAGSSPGDNPIERNVWSVHREPCGPQGRPHRPEAVSASIALWMRRATVSLCRKPTRTDRYRW